MASHDSQINNLLVALQLKTKTVPEAKHNKVVPCKLVAVYEDEPKNVAKYVDEIRKLVESNGIGFKLFPSDGPGVLAGQESNTLVQLVKEETVE